MVELTPNSVIADRLDDLAKARENTHRSPVALRKIAIRVRELSYELHRTYIDNEKKLPVEVRKFSKGLWNEVDYAIEHLDATQRYLESIYLKKNPPCDRRNILFAGQNPHDGENADWGDSRPTMRRDLTRSRY